MAVVRPFRAIRPTSELAAKVAALPYDVMNSEEARQMVVGIPYSFLHVDKAEIDLDPSIDHYDKKVYQKARENLDKMSADGVYIQDEKPCFYLYKQVMGIAGRYQVEGVENGMMLNIGGSATTNYTFIVGRPDKLKCVLGD